MVVRFYQLMLLPPPLPPSPISMSTSTSTCALPTLRQRPSAVGTAGPQRSASDLSGHTYLIVCQDICQVDCQAECLNIITQRVAELQRFLKGENSLNFSFSLATCRVSICQIECQNIWQIECQNDMSDRMPNRMSDWMIKGLSDRMPENMPNRIQKNMSVRMPEYMSDRMPEYMSDRMPEYVSDRMAYMPNRMNAKLTVWILNVSVR